MRIFGVPNFNCTIIRSGYELETFECLKTLNEYSSIWSIAVEPDNIHWNLK